MVRKTVSMFLLNLSRLKNYFKNEKTNLISNCNFSFDLFFCTANPMDDIGRSNRSSKSNPQENFLWMFIQTGAVRVNSWIKILSKTQMFPNTSVSIFMQLNSTLKVKKKSNFDQVYTNPKYDPNRKGRNGTHQFTQYLGVKGYPTMVFFSENGAPIMPVVGYLKPQQLELYLKMIKQGDYQVFSKPEDFEKYQKSFIPRFRG